MSSPLSIAIGGGDHRTNAAVLLITPTRISVGGELGGPSNVLPFGMKQKKKCSYKFVLYSKKQKRELVLLDTNSNINNPHQSHADVCLLFSPLTFTDIRNGTA